MEFPRQAVPFVGENGIVTPTWLLFLQQLLAWNKVAPTTTNSPGTQGQVAYDQSNLWVCVQKDTWLKIGTGGGGGGGTVTSVGLSMPGEFSVAGSPVTGSGTLAVSKSNQAANTFWRGPTSGPPAPPGFGPITLADLPAIPDIDTLAADQDVSFSGLSTGNFLRYDGVAAKWKNANITSGDLPPDIDTLAGDTDVSFSGLADGDFLRYNNSLSKWQNHQLVQSDLPAQPYDMWIFLPGKPSDGMYLLRNNFTRSVTFPAGLTASQAICRVGPAGSITLPINKNGGSVGSVNFAGAATSGTFTFASQVVFAAGDRISITAPSPQDASFADFGLNLVGTR